jgi:hypothetical protein
VPHVRYEDATGFWVCYDEAGLQLHYSKDKKEVVEYIKQYAKTLGEKYE